MCEQTIAAVIKNCPPGSESAKSILLVAVSGGADSTAMLVALAALRERTEVPAFELRCIHVEHGIRPAEESRGDAEFVRSLCEKLHVPCTIVSIKPGKVAALAKKRGIGIEAAARLYRRKAWFRELRRLGGDRVGDHVVVAHTADDLLETALMRIFRGVGPSGLAAMPVSRGRILRPLLQLSRADVIAYLTEKNINWREDSTNTDTQFLRNRVRHRLIPQLNEHFPQWRKAIASLAETQSLAAAFISDEVARRVKWQPPKSENREQGTESKVTCAENFFAQPVIVREEALFQGIDTLLARSSLPGGIKRANIRRFSQKLVTAIDLGRLSVRREGGNIVLTAKKSAAHKGGVSENGFSLLIKAPGSYNLKGIDISVRKVNKCPADSGERDGVFFALLPLVVRPCFKGDRIISDVAVESGASERLFSVIDSRGIAAIIGSKGLLQCRETAALDDDRVQVVIDKLAKGV